MQYHFMEHIALFMGDCREKVSNNQKMAQSESDAFPNQRWQTNI